MTKLEKTVEALRRCVPQAAFDKAMAEIEASELSVTKPVSADVEVIIREILLELGVPDHVKGHRCLVEALRYTIEHGDMTRVITKELYPAVAKMFNDTPNRVERSIRHAIEVAWERCDLDVLAMYFGNTVSPSKGKPTNGAFITRVANVIRQRMREA